jgi:hypothetical protein
MKTNSYISLLLNSFSSSAPYVELLRASFWKTMGFFWVSMLIIGLSLAARFQFKTVPYIKHVIHSTSTEISENYPQDLTFSWSGERLDMSLNSPLEIAYPSSSPRRLPFPETLGYISPEEINIGDFERQFDKMSLLVITPTQLYVSDLQDDWTQFPLSSLLAANFTINQQNLPQHLEQTQSFLINQLRFVSVLAWIGLPIWLAINQLITCFILGLFMTFAFRLHQMKVSFWKSWQLALHIAVIAEAINQLSLWLYPNTDFPMYSLAFWLIFAFVVWTNRPAMHKLANSQK